MPAPGFDGLCVLTLESRRANEQAALISKFAGRPLVAPSIREVPLDSQADAVACTDAIIAGHFACTMFLTGVGARALLTVVEQTHPREAFLAALSRTRVVVRGPKPLAVLREWQVPVWVAAPEPNTWREVLAAVDAKRDEFSLAGQRIAVQEYGVTNAELIEALTARGALVTAVPIYRWALPDDIEPLRQAVAAIGRGDVDVIVLTSGVQLVHLWKIAQDMAMEDVVRRALARSVIASIGPTTSAEIRLHGLEPDLEASHPKMGILVTEAAARAGQLLHDKRRA